MPGQALKQLKAHPTHLQVGKSGASWITQALLLLCGSISAAMPLTAAIFGAVVTSFFFAVSGLHREMAVRAAHPCGRTRLCMLWRVTPARLTEHTAFCMPRRTALSKSQQPFAGS